MHRILSLLAASAFAVAVPLSAASAAPVAQLSGALFTTDVTGVPVNLNHYADKRDVYLNGGPGINAPVDAAGLPAGTYTYQVTDPSGRTLLSTDPIACRQVTVDASGRFTSVAPSGACAHATGVDGEDGGITVQLFPFADTPNNGGVYKAWITPTSALACESRSSKHCFVPADSKTDNFKVDATSTVEIDTTFERDGQYVDGLAAEWTDTLGASNTKYSEWNPAVLAFHEAHVEAAEQGTHQIVVSDQPGCTIAQAVSPTGAALLPVNGSVSVKVSVKSLQAGDRTYFIRVHCH